MKKSFKISLFILLLCWFQSMSQSARVYFYDSYYTDGNTVYVPCNLTSLNVTSQVFMNNSWSGVYLSQNGSIPSGWSTLDYSYYGYSPLPVSIDQNGGTIRFEIFSVGGGYFITLNVKRVSALSFSTVPNLGNNQSGTASVSVNNLGLSYNNTYWETTGGLRVNGNMSATIGGDPASATMSTTNFGGKLRVRANNNCGQSGDWIETVIGTPYILSKTVNGSPAQSANYVGSSAVLNVLTDGTANNCTWSIDGGSGSISPSGLSCNIYISGSFLRVRTQPTNQYGSGESYVFYLLNGSGYRMASSNPTKSGSPI